MDVDYSNIEARILLWIAGDKEKLENYRDGVDNYKVMASLVFDKSIEDVDDQERFLGKTGILGCGYGTGVAKFASMLVMFGYRTPEEQIKKFRKKNSKRLAIINEECEAFSKAGTTKYQQRHTFWENNLIVRLNTDDPRKSRRTKLEDFKPISDDAIEAYLRIKLARKIVNIYRKDNTKVVDLWKEVDTMAKEAIRDKGREVVSESGMIKMAVASKEKMGVETLLIRLPSGHCLSYPRPRLKEVTKEMVNEEGESKKFTSEAIVFYGKRENSVHWGDVHTYGARLVENICQAIGGDFLTEGIINAEEHGYETFLVVHDQALAVKKKGQSVEEYAKLLTKLPRWAEGFPLDADGQETKSYTK